MNPEAIGIKVSAIIQLKVDLPLLEQVVDDLKKLREVRFITSTSGEYQLIAQIAVQTHDILTASFTKLRNIHGIVGMNSIIQFQVFKNTFELV